MVSFWYSCGEVPAAIEASLIWDAAFAARGGDGKEGRRHRGQRGGGLEHRRAHGLQHARHTGAKLAHPAEGTGKRRADALQSEANPCADIDGSDQPLLGCLDRAAELGKARSALCRSPASAGHALPQFVDGGTSALGRRFECADRTAEIDLLAGPLQLREGVLASLAEIGERALDLVATSSAMRWEMVGRAISVVPEVPSHKNRQPCRCTLYRIDDGEALDDVGRVDADIERQELHGARRRDCGHGEAGSVKCSCRRAYSSCAHWRQASAACLAAGWLKRRSRTNSRELRRRHAFAA